MTIRKIHTHTHTHTHTQTHTHDSACTHTHTTVNLVFSIHTNDSQEIQIPTHTLSLFSAHAQTHCPALATGPSTRSTVSMNSMNTNKRFFNSSSSSAAASLASFFTTRAGTELGFVRVYGYAGRFFGVLLPRPHGLLVRICAETRFHTSARASLHARTVVSRICAPLPPVRNSPCVCVCARACMRVTPRKRWAIVTGLFAITLTPAKHVMRTASHKVFYIEECSV